MPVFLRPAIKIPQTGDRCYVQGASSIEDSISSLGTTRETFTQRIERGRRADRAEEDPRSPHSAVSQWRWPRANLAALEDASRIGTGGGDRRPHR
jgi:hypothetical protein